jgi:diaminopimelate decarboxylase
VAAEWSCARQELAGCLTPTDPLSADSSGNLLVEGCAAADLLARYGSPLFVVSEQALRANYRRVRAAFGGQWPTASRVFYAIKSNNNLAVRAVLSDEGAAGECFGAAELLATLAGGADPAHVVLNGSNKTEQELALAVGHGVVVNIDGEREWRTLARLARTAGRRVRVNLRLKVAPQELDELASDTYQLPRGELRAEVLREKWGFSAAAAPDIVRGIMAADELELLGYHLHVPRACQEPELHASCGRELVRAVGELAAATGFVPAVLDVGGGWARERDPESRALTRNPFTIEDYATLMCAAMRTELAARSLPVPELWVEPGRYLSGNAGILLTTVGTVKRDVGHTWVNVDASTNLLPRIESRGCRHVVLPAAGMDRPYTERVRVVGPICVESLLAGNRPMPSLASGEPLAVLDAGMYAESGATQFNAVPRPATVLVNGASSDVIRERETIADVFRAHRLPDRLRASAGPRGLLEQLVPPDSGTGIRP